MPNITITNVDQGSVILNNPVFRDELLVFAAADTYLEGTILARRSVATAVTASAVTGTGNGTVTSATVIEGPIVPLVGAYVLTVVTAVANGGVWKLVDPNGALVAGNLIMTVGAGAATIFEAGGLRFTITDGSTDFAAGDTATLTVAADGKMVPFAPGGAGGAQIPLAVLGYEVTRASGGNEPIRAMVKGDVIKNRLVIDGSAAGVGITDAILDQLRDFGIAAVDTRQLLNLDNQ